MKENLCVLDAQEVDVFAQGHTGMSVELCRHEGTATREMLTDFLRGNIPIVMALDIAHHAHRKRSFPDACTFFFFAML